MTTPTDLRPAVLFGGPSPEPDISILTGLQATRSLTPTAKDGTAQAPFARAGMAYTGPSLVGAYLGMDKLAFTAVAAAAGLPTLPRVAVTAETEAIPFPPPYMVTPRFRGS